MVTLESITDVTAVLGEKGARMDSVWALDALAAALRTDGGEDPRDPFDMGSLVSVARKLRVAPLLYYQLRQAPGHALRHPEIMGQLEVDYLSVAGANILRFRELARILKFLGDEGIPAILLKGSALAQAVYPTIGCRSMKDMDILVPQRQVKSASEALEANGYRFLADGMGHTRSFRESFDGELVFQRQHGGAAFNLDLHWHIVSAYPWLRHLWTVDMAPLWHRAIPVSVNEVTALRLSPEDTLLHLCIHAAAHYKYQGILPFCDIKSVLSTCDIDWGFLVSEAVRAGSRVATYFSLFLTSELVGARIPAGVFEELRPGAWRRTLVARLVPPVAQARNPSFGRRGEVLFHLLLADSLGRVARVAAHAFFPHRGWLAGRYGERGPKMFRRRFLHLAKMSAYAFSSLRGFLSGVSNK